VLREGRRAGTELAPDQALRALVRLRPNVARDSWDAVRAALVLLRRGQVQETQAILQGSPLDDEAGELSPWLKLLASAAHIEAGTPGTQAAGKARIEGTTWQQLCESLLRANQLWRQRERSAALELVRELSCRLGSAPWWVATAAAEVIGIVAAEMGDLELTDVARKWLKRQSSSLRRVLRQMKISGSRWSRVRKNRIRVVARRLRVRGRMLEAKRKFESAIQAASRERRLYICIEDRRRVAACLNNEGICALEAQRSELAQQCFEQCCELREQFDDERGLVVALNNLALALTSRGQFGRAIGVLSRARAVAERNGLERQRDVVELHLGVAYSSNGQARQALRTFGALARSLTDDDDVEFRGRTYANVIRQSLDCGHVGSARHWLAALESLSRHTGNVRVAELVISMRGLVALRTGDGPELAKAIEALDRIPGALSVDIEALRARVLAEKGRQPTKAQLRGLRRRVKGVVQQLAALRLCTELCQRRVTPQSLQRVRKLGERSGGLREVLEWCAVALRQCISTSAHAEELTGIVLSVLSDVRYREANDDVHIVVRARCARALLLYGRAREAWGLMSEAADRLARIERWSRRFVQSGGDELLRKLGGEIRASFGGSSARSERNRTPIATRVRDELLRSPRMVSRAAKGVAKSSRGLGLDPLAARLRDCENGSEAIAAVLDYCRRETGCERVALILCHGETWDVAASSSASNQVIDQGSLSRAVIGEAMLAGRPAVYRDALTAEELAGHRSVAALSLRSAACVPWRAPAGGVGGLYADHRAVAGLFDTDDLALMELTGYVCGVLIQVERVGQRERVLTAELESLHAHMLRGARSRFVGELAVGIAHDLKNVLAAILGKVQLLRLKTSDDVIRSGTQSIEQAVRGAASLVQRVHELGRERSGEAESSAILRPVVDEAIELARYRDVVPLQSGGQRVAVDIDVPDGIRVGTSPSELLEVLLNLVINAFDAMRAGGKLTVLARTEAGGEMVHIHVRDTGAGMDEQTRRRIFEPFFTTKGAEGSGLGLAVVRSIVIRRGGSVTANSTPGQGSEFVVALPGGERSSRSERSVGRVETSK